MSTCYVLVTIRRANRFSGYTLQWTYFELLKFLSGLIEQILCHLTFGRLAKFQELAIAVCFVELLWVRHRAQLQELSVGFLQHTWLWLMLAGCLNQYNYKSGSRKALVALISTFHQKKREILVFSWKQTKTCIWNAIL